jgi:RNA polymerase sigma-70 factor (ECF subfamily)
VENETYQLIHEAIKNLSPQGQRVIEYSLDGLKNADIAKELGITIIRVFGSTIFLNISHKFHK